MQKRQDSSKSIKRVKKEATQEFFNKKRATSAGTQFTFNKAPINKAEAKKEFIEDREKKQVKRTAFTAKLYRDDNELDEMKILAGDQFDSDIDEQTKPRDAKAQTKKQDFSSKPLTLSKIGRLHLTKGSVAMFAVSEFHKGQYAVVNHTRNVKGYLALKDLPELTLSVGQLIICSVTSVGLGVNEKGTQSKKLQLSIDPSTIYRSLQVSKVTPGMFLQATVESKEEKGYFLNLGFKDEAKGFLKFEATQALKIGQLVYVTVLSASSKLVKCQAVLSACVQSTESVLVNEHTLKAGFLVNAKVAKIYENGVEISFLGGMTGTVFIDHLGRENPTKFKIGEKIQARCISHDVQTKLTNLSLLTHILEFKAKSLCELGAVFEKCKVTKITYGGSYQVKIGNDYAFLHKSHLPGANQVADEEDPDKKKKVKVIDELEAGQVVDKVRVKELNYFDGVAHVTMRSNIVNTVALDYGSLEVGQFVNAMIDSVTKTQVNLSLNEFVKGVLKLEHMADYPVKQIPPKFTQTGKQIKVRVFALDERQIIFTKKESLMKHDVTIYKTIKEVKKGDKVYGVVVAQNEHGFIVKSFGEVKGLLTLAENKHKVELKQGSFVKSYVLFNKKGKGLALTLDKKKARESKDKDEVVKSLQEYLPTDEEIVKLKEQYSSYVKHSGDCVSQQFTFKVVETHSNFYVLKTVLDKKTKFGVMPKPLASAFGLSLQLDSEHFTFEGFVVYEFNKVPIISINPVLTKLKDMVPTELVQGKPFVGIVEQTSSKHGLVVKFPTFSTPIAIKDLQHTSVDSYQVGQVLLAALNKAGRLSCKDIVLNKVMTSEEQQQQKSILLNAFAKLHEQSLSGFQIGQKLDCKIVLVKEYGLIVQVDATFTGFIVNEQRLKQSGYKVGQTLTVSVLDVDYDKKIIDLTEKPKSLKIQVELAKEQYMIVSSKAGYGVCLLQGINDVKTEQLYSKYHVGDELAVKLVPNLNQNKELQLMVLKSSGEESKVELKEGALINGQLRSIKGHCLFVQVGANGRLPLIGRLHKIECPDFNSFQVGQSLSVKVLKVSQGKCAQGYLDHGKQMIELTRRQEHLDLPNGRLSDQIPSQLSDFKEGQPIKAMVTEITPDLSCPIQIQVSPFVHGSLLFSDVVTAAALQHSSITKILGAYKVGQMITVYLRQGQFSLHLHDASMKTLKRGDLCVARYVKVQTGFGVTVQLNHHNFGIIEICELSDDIQGCIYKAMKARQLFVARVIDTDKKGRLMLSARDSVIQNWAAITSGSTAQFQQLDSKLQQQGNLRNKILKFGNKALQANDLFVGYVSNISKAGCFVQIGHSTTVRIGLNELDDSETFNFQEQMVIGRMVCGRITKTMGEGEDIRFNASLRKSIVIHGVGLITRNQLKVGQNVQAFILATSADFAFAQINGSYLKLKVYKCKESIGTVVEVKLTKVEPENVKADFVGISTQAIDQVPGNVWQSVCEEARQDVLMAKVQVQNEVDIESAVKRNAVEQQITDLQTIQEIQDEVAGEDSDEGEGGDDDEEMEDSDEEAMQKIKSKNYDEDEDVDMADESGEDDAESGEDDAESGEASDVKMESPAKFKGKKALRQQITQEKEIRQKEQQITQNKLQPQSISDFERLLVSDQNQSFLWIQYMAFMLDKLDLEAARKIAERAVKSVDMTAEEDKLNIWIGYLNLENSFGDQRSLSSVVQRALECNNQKKVYLQLVNIYRTSNKTEYVEPIYQKLCKKYFNELDVWSDYLEYLFDSKQNAKPVLQKGLQALPKHLHINIISKYGMLEYKHGQVESGRTMFEGIVSNYPKRMDIWAIYMDMEVKYSNNQVQARHLFERCLSLQEINKKPRSMKLVFRKYMEFENQAGNTAKVAALRQRVEEYLEKAFHQSSSSSDEDEE